MLGYKAMVSEPPVKDLEEKQSQCSNAPQCGVSPQSYSPQQNPATPDHSQPWTLPS